MNNFKTFLKNCVYFGFLPEDLVRDIACIIPTTPTGNKGHSKIIPDKVLEDLFALIRRDNNFEFAYYIYISYTTTSRPNEIGGLKKSLYHQKHGSLIIRQFKTSDWKLMEQVSGRPKAISEAKFLERFRE